MLKGYLLLHDLLYPCPGTVHRFREALDGDFLKRVIEPLGQCRLTGWLVVTRVVSYGCKGGEGGEGGEGGD